MNSGSQAVLYIPKNPSQPYYILHCNMNILALPPHNRCGAAVGRLLFHARSGWNKSIAIGSLDVGVSALAT
jgi:hypothetical protein